MAGENPRTRGSEGGDVVSDTPRTNLIMDNIAVAISADTREQSIAHREEAHREIEQLELINQWNSK